MLNGHVEISADVVLNHLTTRQHLSPRESVLAVLQETIEKFGCCSQAIDRAVEWLGVDPTQSIGRLRRTELVQLSRSVHRFWMQNLAAADATHDATQPH